jgi:hypothetical protein
VVVGCLAVIAFGPLSSAQALPTASIAGTVTSFKGAKELKGIEVTLRTVEGVFEGSVVTNAKGEYKLTGLAEGEYTVTFYDPLRTYLTQEHAVTLEEGKASTVNAVLKEGDTISGRVTSAANGDGLEGVPVYAYGEDYFFGESYFAETTSGGFYTIKDVAPGTYFIEFSAPSEYVSQNAEGSVFGEGDVAEVNVGLKETGKISGTVTDAVTHSGLEKIRIIAESTGKGGGGVASTNSSGEYTISGLESGTYKLRFEWEFSESEIKEFENAPRYIPKYITQYYNGQVSASSANTVGTTEGGTTSGINVAMVQSLPVNTALPAITGTSTVGSPLSCSSGSWTGEPELTLATGWPLTSPFGYQWLLEGAAITGATSDSFVVQTADVGHGLVCEVTATNDAGKASAKSSSFTVVPPVPVIKIATSKLSVSKNTTKVSIACASASCTGTIKAVETVVTKHKKGHKTIIKKEKIVVATGSYSLTAGQTGTVALHLTSIGKKKLAKAPHHTLSVKLIASLTGGKAIEKAVKLAGH